MYVNANKVHKYVVNVIIHGINISRGKITIDQVNGN